MPHHATVTSSSDTLRQEIVISDRHHVSRYDDPHVARRQGWPLDEVAADVSLDTSVRPARCAIAVRLPEDLSETQRRRLEYVAKACAVHRTLERGFEFEDSTFLAATSTV